MSTIAFDGKILAADKQTTWGNTPKPGTKVFCTPDLIYYGATGNKEMTQRFCSWVESGMFDDEKPKIEKTDEGFSALVIIRGVLYTISDRLEKVLVEPPWALGSGADFALGAMAAGADAIKAVGIACELDVYTGLGIDHFIVEEAK